jgi:gas vesicle protein
MPYYSHDSHSSDQSLQNFLLGLLVGVLGGGLLALLLSPNTGEDNRKAVQKLAHDIPESIKEEIENPYSKTSDFINKQRYHLEQSLSGLKKSINSAKQTKAKEKEEQATTATSHDAEAVSCSEGV